MTEEQETELEELDQNPELKTEAEEAESESIPEALQDQETPQTNNDGLLIAEQLLGAAINISSTKKRLKEEQEQEEDHS